jgi:hypothetical protein
MWGQMCRASSVPFLLPAVEKGWHGYPAHTTSTGPKSARTRAQSAVVMSPRFGTPGWWWARIAAAPGSVSDTHTGTPPNTV